jgi:hypothetical protein
LIPQNPKKSKLPVVYLMDSITKNCGAVYVESFSAYLPSLIPGIYDLSEAAEERTPLSKVVTLWLSRNAFNPAMLKVIQSSLQNSDLRRPIHPVPSGWPAYVCLNI